MEEWEFVDDPLRSRKIYNPNKRNCFISFELKTLHLDLSFPILFIAGLSTVDLQCLHNYRKYLWHKEKIAHIWLSLKFAHILAIAFEFVLNFRFKKKSSNWKSNCKITTKSKRTFISSSIWQIGISFQRQSWRVLFDQNLLSNFMHSPRKNQWLWSATDVKGHIDLPKTKTRSFYLYSTTTSCLTNSFSD